MDKDVLKVLIAVDVQNCFIHGGSLGAPLAEKEDSVDYKSASDYKGGEASIQQAKDIFQLMKGKDVVVITRDSHPNNHKSFGVQGGIYPEHCRKSKVSIKPKFEDIEGGATFNGQLIAGPDPAVAFDMVAESPEDKALLAKIKNCDMNIGLTNSRSNLANPEEAKYECIGRPSGSGPIFIDVRKGEFPTMDAYSAFMYHVTYPDGMNSGKNDGPVNPKLSTRLLEVLLSTAVNPENKPLDISVCGLVGNICVMYTVSYGNAYAKLVQTDRAQFVANTKALGLTPGGIPIVNFTFLGRKGTQWLRTLDGKSGFLGYSGDEWTSNEKAEAVETKMVDAEIKRLDPSATVTLNFGASGGRRRARPQTKKAAKKTCYPGYEVYNFRKNSRGVFYNCLPKKRKTRRRKA
jgi:nicotinamidase-related amidase